MTDKSIMPFGKHQGEKMANVPPNYLLFLFNNNIAYGELKDYIADNIELLKEEAKKPVR